MVNKKRFKRKNTFLYILFGVIFSIVFISLINIFDKQTYEATFKGKDIYDLQMTACHAAEEGGTCNSKLKSLGFIMPEECCRQFGKCC